MEAACIQCRGHVRKIQIRVRPRSRGARNDLNLRVVCLRCRTVTGRGEVRHAFCDDLIDCLRNDTVLEERFIEIDDVVDDHVGLEARAVVRCRRITRECANVVCEAQFPGVRRREAEFRLRREVVHDLQHRSAFVSPRREVLENDHRLGVTRRIARTREIAARDVECRAVRRDVGVIAVGHHAHRDPRAIDARRQFVHTVLYNALAVGGADVGDHRARGHNRKHTLGARNAQELFDGHISFDEPRAVRQIRRNDLDARDPLQRSECLRRSRRAIERNANECAVGIVELHWRGHRHLLSARRGCALGCAGRDRWCDELLQAFTKICGFIAR